MKPIAIAALLGALVIAGSALAHHPFAAEFDASAPLRLTGKITKVDWKDPHLTVHLAVVDTGGQTREWNIEAGSPSMLQKKGWQKDALQEGAQISVQGYRAKSEPFTAAARVIVLPDGKSMSSGDDDDGAPKI